MRELASFILLLVAVGGTAAALIIVLRNELEIREKTSGGYGLVPIFGFMLVFVVMPVFAFFVRF